MIKNYSLLMLVCNLFFSGLFAPQHPTPKHLTPAEMRAARVAFFSSAGGAAGSVASGAAPALPVAATQTVSEGEFCLAGVFNWSNGKVLAFRTSPSLQAVIRNDASKETRLVNFDVDLNVTSEIVLSAEILRSDYSHAIYLPDGQSFLALNHKMPVKIINAATGALKVELNRLDRDGNKPHAYCSPNGQKVVLSSHYQCGTSGVAVYRSLFGFAVMDTNTGEEITLISDVRDESVESLIFHPQSEFVAVASCAPEAPVAATGSAQSRWVIKVFNTNNGVVVNCSPPLPSCPRDVKYCCNGDAIIFLLKDGLYKWVPGSAELVGVFTGMSFTDLICLSDGNICVVKDFFNKTYVVNLETHELIKDFFMHNRVAFSPDGKLAVYGYQKSIFLVDAKTFEVIQEIKLDSFIKEPGTFFYFLDSSDGFILKRFKGFELYRFKTFMEIKIAQDATTEHVARVKAFSSSFRKSRTALETECHTEQHQLFHPIKKLLDLNGKEEVERKNFDATQNRAFLELQQQHVTAHASLEYAIAQVKKFEEIGDCCSICRFGACSCVDFDINEPEKFCETCQVNTRLRPSSPGAFVTSCGHLFHRECLKSWFNTRAESGELVNLVVGTDGVRRYCCPACQKHVAVPADFFAEAPAAGGGGAAAGGGGGSR